MFIALNAFLINIFKFMAKNFWIYACAITGNEILVNTLKILIELHSVLKKLFISFYFRLVFKTFMAV